MLSIWDAFGQVLLRLFTDQRFARKPTEVTGARGYSFLCHDIFLFSQPIQTEEATA